MSDSQQSAASPADRPGRGRAWTVGAAVVIALIVLAGLVVVFATRGGDVPPPAADSEPAAAVTSAPPASAAPPLPTVDQTVPEAPPPGVTWSLFQGVALPSSPTEGAARVDGPVHTGCGHTPTGALLAAAHQSYRYLITPGNGWQRVVEE